jgi:uncharacterized protein YbjT (DUF2867 family)
MNGTEILVTGGTGTLGSRVVERLRSAGIEPRILSHSNRPGTIRGDLRTGEGLEEAVSGADTIIHSASSPFRKMHQTDVEGTRRLLDAAYRADVSHLVYISIVGIDRARSFPYYRVKQETEKVVEGSPVAHTILRATQFHDLVLLAVRALARLPVVPVPKGLILQPIDSGEVADRMVELALSDAAGRVEGIGGPEVRSVEDMVRAYLKATGSRKRLVPFSLPGETARAIRTGALMCPDNRYGRITWEQFLREALDRNRR